MHTEFQLGNMKLKDHLGQLMCMLQSKFSFDVKIKYNIKRYTQERKNVPFCTPESAACTV